jgi:tRNA G18 (ribose-2'-O)-methylase SpoU
VVSAFDPHLLLAALDQKRVAVFAALPRAETTAAQSDLSGRTALVIGSEGHGVSALLSSRARGVRIPTHGVESLNAAVAAGILLYEAARQRTKEKE